MGSWFPDRSENYNSTYHEKIICYLGVAIKIFCIVCFEVVARRLELITFQQEKRPRYLTSVLLQPLKKLINN